MPAALLGCRSDWPCSSGRATWTQFASLAASTGSTAHPFPAGLRVRTASCRFTQITEATENTNPFVRWLTDSP